MPKGQYERKIVPIEDRFWPKVNKNGPIPVHVPELGPCWNWTACTYHTGYGQFNIQGRLVRAHRLSYEMAYGAIPPGEGAHGTCVLHKCDNPLCVRPTHLFLGTHHENQIDKAEKDRAPYNEDHWNYKLTDLEVAELVRCYRRGGDNAEGIEYALSYFTSAGIQIGEPETEKSEKNGFFDTTCGKG